MEFTGCISGSKLNATVNLLLLHTILLPGPSRSDVEAWKLVEQYFKQKICNLIEEMIASWKPLKRKARLCHLLELLQMEEKRYQATAGDGFFY